MNRVIYPASAYPLSGDLQSHPGDTKTAVVGIQGVAVTQVTMQGGEVLAYDLQTNAWVPRKLASTDLPVATASTVGAVMPDGSTTTVDASGKIIANIPATPSGPANQVFATPNGSTGSAALRPLVGGDLPTATSTDKGAVYPDETSITVDSNGKISVVGGGSGGGYPKVIDSTSTAVQSANFTHSYPTSLPAGVYRIQVWASVTQVNGTSGSSGLQATLSFTDAVTPVNYTICITSALPVGFTGNSAVTGVVSFYSNGSPMTLNVTMNNSGDAVPDFIVQMAVLERLV